MKKNKKTIKWTQYFSENEKPKLNVTEKIEVRTFEGNNEKKKRSRHPLLDVHNFLDHSLQRE